MDVLLSFAGLIALLIVAFIVARFVLHLAGRVIGCILTVIVALGILAIILIFFL
jgi:hypothetical protein